MKYTAGTALTVASTLLIGFWLLAWLLEADMAIVVSRHGNDSRDLLVNGIGLAGLLLAAMAFREVRLQKQAAEQLERENKSFV